MQLLDDLCIPQKGREHMLALDDAQKRELLAGARSDAKRKGGGSSASMMSALSDKLLSKEIEQQRLKVPTTPEYFRAQLDHEYVGEVKEEVLLALRVALSTRPTTWLQRFLELGCLDLLLHPLIVLQTKPTRAESDDAVALAALRCIKSLMSSPVGLTPVVQHPQATRIFAFFIMRSVLANDIEAIRNVGKVALELCTAVSAFSPVAHQMSIEALETLCRTRSQPTVSAVLVDLLEDCELPVKTGIVIFINCLVLGYEDKTKQIAFQQQLLDSNILSLAERLEESIPRDRGQRERSDESDALLRNLQVLRTNLTVSRVDVQHEQRKAIMQRVVAWLKSADESVTESLLVLLEQLVTVESTNEQEMLVNAMIKAVDGTQLTVAGSHLGGNVGRGRRPATISFTVWKRLHGTNSLRGSPGHTPTVARHKLARGGPSAHPSDAVRSLQDLFIKPGVATEDAAAQASDAHPIPPPPPEDPPPLTRTGAAVAVLSSRKTSSVGSDDELQSLEQLLDPAVRRARRGVRACARARVRA